MLARIPSRRFKVGDIVRVPSVDGTADVPVLATGIGFTLRRKLHVEYKGVTFEIDAGRAQLVRPVKLQSRARP